MGKAAKRWEEREEEKEEMGPGGTALMGTQKLEWEGRDIFSFPPVSRSSRPGIKSVSVVAKSTRT